MAVRLMCAGPHERKPSHLAPAEERAKIVEESRKQEAKRAVEALDSTARAAAAVSLDEDLQNIVMSYIPPSDPGSPKRSTSIGTAVQVSGHFLLITCCQKFCWCMNNLNIGMTKLQR